MSQNRSDKIEEHINLVLRYSPLLKCVDCDQRGSVENIEWINLTDDGGGEAYCLIVLRCPKCKGKAVSIYSPYWIDGMDGVLDVLEQYK